MFTNIFQPPTRRPFWDLSLLPSGAGQVYFGTCATQLLDIFADSESKGCANPQWIH